MELNLIYLFVFAFLAGYIDSVVGGGGLIQLPAYLIFAPQLHLTTVLGSNKLSAFMGTLVATARYLRSTQVIWNAIIPALISCLIFSFLGAKMVSHLNTDYLRIVILVLLVAVAVYTFIKKDFGLSHLPTLSARKIIIPGIAIGSILGFYDGFFGPGTGSFLLLAYVTFFGFNFLHASVSAKIINCATNFAALVFFVYGGQVDYTLAVPVGICNMAGSFLGASMAIKKGSRFVRIFFLVIVTGLILKFTYSLFQ
jgi:uncharacterized membrane protein YfcA